MIDVGPPPPPSLEKKRARRKMDEKLGHVDQCIGV
jgi:hypothetical protein